MATIIGSVRNDTITPDLVTPGVIGGAPGDDPDSIAADGGGFIADFGNDLIDGGGGNDTIDGGDGYDTLRGGTGDDSLDGGRFDDVLDGGDGNDTMRGGGGSDTYIVDSLGDVLLESPLFGEGVVDRVRTALAAYELPANIEFLHGLADTGQRLVGNAIANFLEGGAGDDTLSGEFGNDQMIGGAGADLMMGGRGDDTYVVDDVGDLVVEAPDGGRDLIVVGRAAFTLPSNVEDIIGSLSGAAQPQPMGFALVGNALGNAMSGADGDDTLDGNAGNDTLDGGAGTDTMRGGTQDDTYRVDHTGDRVQELADQGRDQVETTLARYVLPAHVEILIGVSMGRQELYGNALDNIIVGGFGDNALAGGAGNDSLSGGGGFNRLFGGVGNDSYTVSPSGDHRVVEWRDEGIDTVYALAPVVVLAANVENLVAYDGDVQLTVVGAPKKAWKLTGNSLDNTITGLDGADTLYGGLGADTLDGGAGDDTLLGGAGSDLYRVNLGDVVAEVMGAGDDTVLATEGTRGFALGPNIEVLVLQGEGLEIGAGNTIANTILGNDRGNVLYGFGGADLLEGGAGDDQLWGNGDADTLDGGAGTDLLFGGAGSDLLEGGAGDDQLWGNDDADTLDGGAGTDVLFGGTGSDLYVVGTGDVVVEATGAGDDTVIATEGTGFFELRPNIEVLVLQGAALENVIGNAVGNTILGNGLANLFYGFGGADLLEGGAGDDSLYGYGDADTLAGGDGADLLFGGPGADVFRIDRVADSSPLAPDQIFDFASLGGQAAPEADDRIQLDAIDANTLIEGDQAFEWIGTAAFGALGAASAGELRAFLVTQRGLRVEGDVDGDGLADLRVDLVLTPATEAPGAHWFIL